MDWCSYFRTQKLLSIKEVEIEIDKLCKKSTTDLGSSGLRKVSSQKEFVILDDNGLAIATISLSTWFVKKTPAAPHWLLFASEASGQDLTETAFGQSFSAIILVELEKQCYVLTFGMGHILAKKLPIERRFGKIVVSNGKLPNEVRSISGRTHGTYGKARKETRGQGGPIRILELPRLANMASGIGAKMEINGVEVIAEGSSQIRAMAPTNILNLYEILTSLDHWWNDGIEEDQELASLDKVEQIYDQTEIDKLNSFRREYIRRKDMTGFSLCLDHEEMWEATSIRYVVNRTSIDLKIPDLHSIFHVLSHCPLDVDPLDVRCYAVIPSRNTEYPSKLADNLAFEFKPPASADTYAFEDGAWFRCKNGWIQEVETDLATLLNQSEIQLQGFTPHPYLKHETEDKYIENHMLDKNLSLRSKQYHRVPTGHNLEFCDILVDGNLLLFIKRGSGRDACMDVCQQALDSLHTLSDPNGTFLEWVNNDLTGKGWKIDLSKRTNITFCILILIGGKRKPSDFSIRSKAALCELLKNVDLLGFKSAITVA